MKGLIAKLVGFNAAAAAIFFVLFVLYDKAESFRPRPDYAAAFFTLAFFISVISFNLITLWKGRNILLLTIKKSAIEGAAIAMEITDAGLKSATHFKNAAAARAQERSKEKADTNNLKAENHPEKISRESAYKSAFTAVKDSFEKAETINEYHELGGFCHYLIHTTQSLFDLYGHTMEHADAWHLVKAAAVASQKYTEERIIEAVMLFDKIELAKEAFTTGRRPS